MASLALALVCAACASAPDIPLPRAGYFISPHGEPFRFDRGESGVARWFALADADEDGRLTRAEFDADAQRYFGDVDADANGLATSAEVSALRSRLAPQLEAMLAYLPAPQPDDDARSTRRPTWRPGTGFLTPQRRGGEGGDAIGVVTLLNEREPVLASDADFNRRVTAEEFAAASEDRFAILDADGDGALTLTELVGRQ